MGLVAITFEKSSDLNEHRNTKDSRNTQVVKVYKHLNVTPGSHVP